MRLIQPEQGRVVRDQNVTRALRVYSGIGRVRVRTAHGELQGELLAGQCLVAAQLLELRPDPEVFCDHESIELTHRGGEVMFSLGELAFAPAPAVSDYLRARDERLLERVPGRSERARRGLVRRLELARLHLMLRFSENPPVAEMAERASMSKWNFSRIFQQVYGLPPHQLMLAQKMHAARQRLSHGNATVDRISFQVGYSNRSAFCRQFRKQTGCTPQEWRSAARS